MKYSFTGKIRYSEIGENYRLTLPALIDYFQDCSTFQSEQIGLGMDWLKERNRAWILVSWQIHVNRYPKMCEEVVVSTWASGFKGIQATRNFTMETVEGEMLAYANSIWIYMDMESGRPDRIDEEVVEPYGEEAPIQAEFGSRKVRIPAEDGQEMAPYTVMEYHLDTNHHVNNGQYIQMCQGYLPVDFEVHDMRAEYRLQAFLGDVMVPERFQTEDGYVITLKNQEGKPYIAVEFQ